MFVVCEIRSATSHSHACDAYPSHIHTRTRRLVASLSPSLSLCTHVALSHTQSEILLEEDTQYTKETKRRERSFIVHIFTHIYQLSSIIRFLHVFGSCVCVCVCVCVCMCVCVSRAFCLCVVSAYCACVFSRSLWLSLFVCMCARLCVFSRSPSLSSFSLCVCHVLRTWHAI